MSKKGLILGHTDVKRSKLRGIKALFDRSLDDRAACQRFLQAFQRKSAKHLVRLTPAIHCAIFAPSGAGKNVSVVEPLLFTSEESAFVTDIKGENAELTARFREEVFGHKIMRLDPWHLTTDKPACWNVLDLIKTDDPEALDKARALAEAIVEKNPNDQQPHWPKKAQDFIAGAIGAVTHFCPPELRSLQQVAEILADKTLLAQVIEKMKHSSTHGGLLARKGYEMSASADKELDGILSTANQSLAFLSTPAVMESTQCTSGFDLEALFQGRGATIYPIIPLQYLKSHGALMRLYLTAFTKYVVSRGIKNPRPVNVILDECAAVMAGHGDTFEEMLTVGRGFNLKVTAIFQSLAQLRKLQPQGQEGVILANTSQIFFGVNEVEDAKYVASRLGEETIIVQDWGTTDSESEQPAGQQGGKSKSYSRSRSLNFRQVGRQLLKPEEVLNGLHPRVAITFTPGRPPIWTWLTRYYEKSFGEPTGLSPAKMIFDTACMFICSAMLAALWTAGLFHHWFK
jgi:type IV secretion system protein VirD4